MIRANLYVIFTFEWIFNSCLNFFIEVQNLLQPSVGKDGETNVFNNVIQSGDGEISNSQYHKHIIAYTIFDTINKKNYNLMNIHFQGRKKKLLNHELLNKLERTLITPTLPDC